MICVIQFPRILLLFPVKESLVATMFVLVLLATMDILDVEEAVFLEPLFCGTRKRDHVSCYCELKRLVYRLDMHPKRQTKEHHHVKYIYITSKGGRSLSSSESSLFSFVSSNSGISGTLSVSLSLSDMSSGMIGLYFKPFIVTP